MKKKVKLQPATHERTCQVCAQLYTYPEKGSASTRHLCKHCAELPAGTVLVLKRMTRRIASLERTVKKLSQPKPKPTKQEAQP